MTSSRFAFNITLFLAVSVLPSGICLEEASAANEAWKSIVAPADSFPDARLAHSAVYDPSRKRILVFGGKGESDTLFNDVWEFSFSCLKWKKLSPTDVDGFPTGRKQHVAVFDSDNDRMLVFGGENSAEFFQDDLWELSFATSANGEWEEISKSGDWPLPKECHSAVYVPGSPPKMFVFAGRDTVGATPVPAGVINDLWEYKMAATPVWDEVEEAVCQSPVNQPKCRVYHTAVWDDGNNEMIIYGGDYFGTIFFQDVWSWDPTSGFTDITPSTGDGDLERTNHTAIYDPVDDRMLVFGGYEIEGGTFQDTWKLSLPSTGDPVWTELSPSGALPSQRQGHSAVYDPIDHRMIVWGGKADNSATENLVAADTTWILLLDADAAPVAITTLDTTVVAPTSISLGWTAPLDHETQVVDYDIRYSTSEINAGNFSSADTVIGEPTPNCPGIHQEDTVTGLTSDVTYYFAMKSKDDAGNWSTISNVISAKTDDHVPPDAVNDLAVPSWGSHGVAVTWTATGDDGNTGTAEEFDLRKSTSNITAANFSSADPVLGLPTPGSPGTEHCKEIDPLTSCTTYYFAIKTKDNIGNWSAISNVESKKTKCSGFSFGTCFLCGLFVQGSDGTEWQDENSILDPWGGEGPVEDTYRLTNTQALPDGSYSLRFLKLGDQGFSIDQARLAAVDHSADDQAFWDGTQFFSGTPSWNVQVTDPQGNDISAQFGAGTDSPVYVEAGEYILVDLGEGILAGDGLLLESSGRYPDIQPDSTGILVQVPKLDGSWRTLTRYYPRETIDQYFVDTQGTSLVRLFVFETQFIQRIGRLDKSATLTPSWLALETAIHSRDGQKVDDLASQDGATVSMLAQDELILEFGAPAAEAKQGRSLFLRVKGDLSGTHDFKTSASEQLAPAWQFALGAAKPNPFTGNVQISYTLGRDTDVSIRVYNLAGRLVRTLASGTQQAGPYSLVWDARDNGGVRVSQGVYFYRMVAGDWTSKRKMVFLGR